MTGFFRQFSVIAACASGVLLFSSQAAGQPAQPVDTLPSVDVVAPKKTGIEAILPGTDKPKSATCEYLASVDPLFREQMRLVDELQNALVGPTVHLPTRPPRNPNYAAAPLTPPGSALPAITPKTRGPVGTERPYSDVRFNAADSDPGESDGITMAVSGCRLTYTRGSLNVARSGVIEEAGQGHNRPKPSAFAQAEAHARGEVARKDTTMQLGFALFDDGRYAEALDQFKAGYKKLGTNHGGDEAALMIGKIYLLGLGAKSDPKQAVYWLDRAALAPFNPTTDMPVFDPDHPENNTAIGEAAVMLGNIYLQGFQGIEKDPDAARKWFARAALVGHVPASKILGDLYYAGYETPRDVSKAMLHYQKAATMNLGAAQVALADIYYTGDKGVPADLAAAINWYAQAAKQDQPGALYALAVAYDTGEGVAADQDKALGYYKNAALQGHAEAQAALASYFYEGVTVAKDLPTARQWFEAAAKGGDADAMFNLGVMLMKGEGGEKDQIRAWAWLKLAQKGGVEQTATALKVLEARMTPEEKQAAAKLHSPTGQS